MGQDRVAAWPSPEPSSPSPEGQRESGTALHPECPPARPVGFCLATWPLWNRHFVPPTPTSQPQPRISPSHCGPGLGDLLLTASAGATKPPCAPSHL
uniref:Uncharacterized protein n=1 Tax=Capra hircus TaxID=9925 RepID=A0A452GBJ7_CAPHI